MRLNTKHRLPELVDREKVAAARAGLPAEEVVRGAVEVFNVLSSPVRVCIMHALVHDEINVGDLARALPLYTVRREPPTGAAAAHEAGRRPR